MSIIEQLLELPRSAKEAAEQKSIFYFTNKHCKKGHLDKRYTTSFGCYTCGNEYRKGNRHIWDKKYRESATGKININKWRNSEEGNKYTINRRVKNKKNQERKIAREKSERYYYTGKACVKGHITKRWVVDGQCCECLRLKQNTPEFRKRRIGPMTTWRKKNKDKLRRQRKEYAKKHPDIKRIAHARRRARINKAGGSFTKQELAALLIKQKHKCVFCFSDISKERHADHIIPVSKGGNSYIHNIQFLCPSCNISKRDKDNDEFFKSTLAALI